MLRELTRFLLERPDYIYEAVTKADVMTWHWHVIVSTGIFSAVIGLIVRVVDELRN